MYSLMVEATDEIDILVFNVEGKAAVGEEVEDPLIVNPSHVNVLQVYYEHIR